MTVIALRAGPSDSTLYSHQRQHFSRVLNPPKPYGGFVTLRAGILAAFLIRCYQESLHLWTPSHSCTCGKHRYDPFSCIGPDCTVPTGTCLCCRHILSCPSIWEEEHRKQVVILITSWRFESYPSWKRLLPLWLPDHMWLHLLFFLFHCLLTN